MARYPYKVKYKGVFYSAGTDVPVETQEKLPLEAPTPKEVAKKEVVTKTKGAKPKTSKTSKK